MRACAKPRKPSVKPGCRPICSAIWCARPWFPPGASSIARVRSSNRPKAAVKSAEIALDGIRQEAEVGQRTTFDILFAQQVLLNTRVSLVVAQRDRVVASYCGHGAPSAGFPPPTST